MATAFNRESDATPRQDLDVECETIELESGAEPPAAPPRPLEWYEEKPETIETGLLKAIWRLAELAEASNRWAPPFTRDQRRFLDQVSALAKDYDAVREISSELAAIRELEAIYQSVVGVCMTWVEVKSAIADVLKRWNVDPLVADDLCSGTPKNPPLKHDDIKKAAAELRTKLSSRAPDAAEQDWHALARLKVAIHDVTGAKAAARKWAAEAFAKLGERSLNAPTWVKRAAGADCIDAYGTGVEFDKVHRFAVAALGEQYLRILDEWGTGYPAVPVTTPAPARPDLGKKDRGHE